MPFLMAKSQTERLIIGRGRQCLTDRTLESDSVFVALADRTNVVQTQGLFKLRRKHNGHYHANACPYISVEGLGDS